MPPLSQCKDPPQPPPSTCFDHKDSITLKVVDGVKQETFSIARGLLRWHSAFFAAALDPYGSSKESTSKKRELKEEIPVVRAFHCWIYTGRLLDPPKPEESSDNQYLSSAVLCKIWVFADFRGFPALKNAAIDMLHESMAAKWATPSDDMILYVYQNSPEGSQLRKFFIYAWIRTKSEGCFKELKKQDVPTDHQYWWATLDRCFWHDHSGPGGMLRKGGQKRKAGDVDPGE
ncbi:hypothetical protein BDV96DRAFT_614485 [Lophiotrema nucula]|uniref:BTB domain-containing protein n=1 Tax=Lophiotrema nucula TaxID=690887 RepID=A0A6A5YYH6_9PLEO|nr:hypothetical protein BDV96DRAFT_614485 [Lophiotrema nucula]